VLGCHCGLPPGPAILMGGIPAPPGPPGARLLLGGGPLRPGPYVPGPIGGIPPGPALGWFIRGFIGFMPGEPTSKSGILVIQSLVRLRTSGGQMSASYAL
jgi:hypothetical protein